MNFKQTLSAVLTAAAIVAGAGAKTWAVPGPPWDIRMTDSFENNYQTILSSAGSNELKISVLDSNFLPTVTGAGPVMVLLSAYQYNPTYTPVPFEISTNNFVNVSTSVIFIPGSSGSTPLFRFRTMAVGQVQFSAMAIDFPSPSITRNAWYSFNVLPGGSGFTGVNIRTDSQPSVSTQTSVTITPDHDGIDDAAVITANPPAGQQWEILVSTVAPGAGYALATSTANVVRKFFQYGQVTNTYWYGENQFEDWRTVPNGTYYIFLQTQGGGIVDSSLSVVVNSAFIKGRVVVQGSSTPVAGANINIYGPGGGGFAQSGPDGKFFVGGLKFGQPYNGQVTKPQYAGTSFSTVASSATDVGDQGTQAGSTVRVSAIAGGGPTPGYDLWGGVFLHDASYSSTFNGGLHFKASATASDNGWPPADPAYLPYTELGVLPGTNYTMQVSVPEYGMQTLSITSPLSGGTTTFFLTFNRKANLSGQINLSTAAVVNNPYGGQWVSIDAIKGGATHPSAWGGGFVPNFSSSATYQVTGVDPGTYTLRAFVQGYTTQVATGVIVGGVDVNYNFPPFSQGGILTGVLTVLGDSSEAQGTQFGGGGSTSCTAGQVPLFVNAWSPSTFLGSSMNVCISTFSGTMAVSSAPFTLTGLDDGVYDLYTYLPGFQQVDGLGNPLFRAQGTVSGGSGSQNLIWQALSGSVDLTVQVSSGSDPALVEYEISNDGPDRVQKSGFVGPGSTVTISGLGTGLYRLFIKDNNTGLQKQLGVAVTNAQATALTVNLQDTVYGISGTVSLEGNLVLPAYSTTVTTVDGLQSVVGVSSAPLVLVFAFPLPENFYGSVSPIRTSTVTVSGTTATFSVNGLTPGTYLLRVKEDLDAPAVPECGNCSMPGRPEMGTTDQVISIATASVTGVNLVLSNGYGLSGTLSRPEGDLSTDTRYFNFYLRRQDNLAVWMASAAATGTASYSFDHLAAGDYTLEVREENTPTPKYVAAPVRVTIGSAVTIANVTLLQSGFIVGKLRDASSNTLLTDQNVRQFLPDNFNIFAYANPWVPGGAAEADRSMSGGGPQISPATGQFTISRLVPDTTFDVTMRGSQDFGLESLSKGQKAYASVVKGGIRVAAGQTVDIGVIDLKQGVTISGFVKDTSGNPLANVLVEARPSFSGDNGDDREDIRAYSDAEGKYVIQGVDQDKRFYNVTAAPRFESGDILGQLSGTKYATEKKANVDVTDPVERDAIDFDLAQANAVLTGSVVTVDGGPLESPFGDRGGFSDRSAAVILHEDSAPPSGDNPLGEIEVKTDPQGNFLIDALKPGSYLMRVVSVGYSVSMKTLVLSAGSNSAGTITLQKGAKVSGTITKSDGSSPSSSEVSFIVGVDANFQEFVFGSVSSNDATSLVSGYSLNGFKTGLTYSILIGNNGDDIMEATSGLTFDSDSEEKTVNLLFKAAAPSVFATQARSGNQVTLRFFSSQKFRNLTADDNDLSQILTVTVGTGTITQATMNSSRDTVTAVYDAPANEASFTVNLSYYSIVVDPDSPTGDNFHFTKDFTFYAGIGKSQSASIPNAIGGECLLEDNPTGGTFPPGTFDVASSSSVEVGVQTAVSLSDLGLSAPAAGPGIMRAQMVSGAALRLGPSAYPVSSLYKAAKMAPSVSPFSSFYDIFLPAGVSHSLKNDALITLKYDDSITDPSGLNVYYFDEGNNVFLLEKSNRTIDTVNKTVTVAVSHLSTFVILSANAPIIGANTFTAAEMFVHNVPNPFNLKEKTVTLNHLAPAADQTFEGTMIKYGLPPAVSGSVKIEIYNMAGELVRTISETAPAGGTYYYTNWDGRNDGGKAVASGVYVGRMTVNGQDEKFFKMAVVK